MTTELTAFVPEARTDTERMLFRALRQGPASRTLLIRLTGAPPQQLAELSQGLADRLRDDPRFRRVANGAQLMPEAERRRWFAYRYLLSPTVTAQRFQADGLEQALAQRLQELASPLGAMRKDELGADPTAEFQSLLARWRPANAPATRFGVWFDHSGRRALLMAETAAAAYDIDAQAEALAAIDAAFAGLRPPPQARLQRAGPGAFAVASRNTTRNEAQRLSGLAALVMAALLWAAYRRFWVVALGALPLVTGLVVAAAAVSLWFGGIHGLTLAFGFTLLGIAIDYPVHVFSHAGSGGLGAAVTRIWPTLALGAVTTALGFGALMASGFTGLAQLGLFAVSGLLMAALVTRWVLPALTPRGGALPPPRGLGLVANLETAQGRLALLPALGLAAALAGGLPAMGITWEDDLATLTPIPDSARALDGELRRALGAPEVSHAVLVQGPDAETALQRTEAVAEQLQTLVGAGHLGGFTAVSHYLPSQRTQRQRQRRLPETAALQTDLQRAVASSPFRRDAFAPFVAAVEQARRQTPLGPEQLADTLLGARVEALLYPGTEGWVSVLPLTQVHDAQALETWAQQAGTAVRYLDQRAAARALMARVRSQGMNALLWGAGLMSLVLLWALRSWRRAVRVLLPVVLATLATLLALAAGGVAVSLFHLMALLMVVGAGLDYSLFFNRSPADVAERRRTFHALLVCAISTTAVFGILSASQLPVLRAIGVTVALGVGASLLFALLLAKPDARHSH